MNPTTAAATFTTDAGTCGIGWSARGVTRLTLPLRDASAAERALARRSGAAPPTAPPEAIAAVIDRVRAYFAGTRTEFADVALDPGPEEAFPALVYAHVRGLTWGTTTTYCAVARALDAGPEAARAVGEALARNPLPLLVPCHRVLAAGGRLGGFSAPGGAGTKALMLAMEGIDLGGGQGAFDF